MNHYMLAFVCLYIFLVVTLGILVGKVMRRCLHG